MNKHLAALKFLVDCLSLEQTGRFADVQKQVRSNSLYWEALVDLANNQLLTPALWVSLKRNGLSDELPLDLVSYLSELHRLSTERNVQLRRQLLQAVRQLNQAGITPVLLKGASHLVSSIYADPGVRIMSDIDLLVDKDQADAAYDSLLELGYKSDESCLKDYGIDHHHCPPLSRPGDYGNVEIHRALMDGYADILSTGEALADAGSISCESLSMKVLSPTHRILHNMVHSQLIDANYVKGIIPLRSLNEVAVESRHAPAPVDWGLISGRMEESGRAEVLRAYLYMAHSLLGMPWPPGRRAALGARLYSMRCKLQLAWDWFKIWGIRWGRFSTTNIRRLYGCGNGFIELNWARARYARRRLIRYIERIFGSLRFDRLMNRVAGST